MEFVIATIITWIIMIIIGITAAIIIIRKNEKIDELKIQLNKKSFRKIVTLGRLGKLLFFVDKTIEKLERAPKSSKVEAEIQIMQHIKKSILNIVKEA